MRRNVDYPLPNSARDAVFLELQPLLVDLLDLSMQTKQAHWTATGTAFIAVHEHLDEINESLRHAADLVAERCTALDRAPDGTCQRVAETTLLPPADRGFSPQRALLARMTDAFRAVTGRTRERIERLDTIDRVSADIVVGITADLEKHCWMLAAHLRDNPERMVARREQDLPMAAQAS